MDIDKIIGFKFDYIPGEFYSSILVMLMILIFYLIIGHKARFYSSDKLLSNIQKKIEHYSRKIEFISNDNKNLTGKQLEKQNKKLERYIKLLEGSKMDLDIYPYSRPSGILNIGEMIYEFCYKNVLDLMGEKFSHFTGYIMVLGPYIFLSFIIGIAGMPNPFTYLGNTISIALVTFIMIHATGVKYSGWKYFKRYIEPIPLWLPINLLSMWAPLFSLTFRLFGNALAGFCLMTLIYEALTVVVNGIPIFVSSIFTPFLHAYFDVFSGGIQTLVFCMLSMIFIAQEAPSPEEDSVSDSIKNRVN